MESLKYAGGPFDLRVSRHYDVVSISLARGSETLVELVLAPSQIDELINALKAVKH